MSLSPRRAGLACAIAALTLPLAAAAAPFSVGLWGNMPFTTAANPSAIPAMIADMNASNIAFSIFDGNFKSDNTPCSDAAYVDALKTFDSLKAPVIYTPGRNDWADCHLTGNGGFDVLNRLAMLRSVLADSRTSPGQQGLKLQTQGAPARQFSENARYTRDGVMFVTVNMPGGDNGRIASTDACAAADRRTPAQCAADNAEYAVRDAANIRWLDESFARAEAAGDKGIVLVSQADPGFDRAKGANINETHASGTEGFAAFLDDLVSQTKGYKGQVLYVDGGSRDFRLDKPMVDATHMLANFTRVETFGYPNVHWVKLTVDPASRAVFTVRPMVVPANAGLKPIAS